MHYTTHAVGSVFRDEVASIRTEYIALFSEQISYIRDQAHPYSLERLSHIGGLNLLGNQYRVDVAWGSPNRPSVSDILCPAKTLALDATIESQTRHITLSPLSWHAVSFELENARFDANALGNWFTVWFGHDVVGSDPTCLSGWIHGVKFYDPAHLIVDFGSAKIDAFFDLIDILQNQGNSPIRISTNDKRQTTNDKRRTTKKITIR